ncbi:response regulator [Pseudomonas sp. gcc21]|uniref:response regulator n=1 Tax=Pseudomonas sp. gcc21 TaxID=2726989 RepID=UPI001451C0D0|nr:response regulator [Pseudomonas sp. gcc21]QJD59691.1 response regulator [Pseudomonas sp. gcc21]
MNVLIVEDEALIAMLLEEMLDTRGYNVAAHASTLAEGETMASSLDVDVAILDVSLAGETVFPVAERLSDRGIPFMFTTGFGAAGMPEAWADRPVFSKPYEIDSLIETIQQLVPNAPAAAAS